MAQITVTLDLTTETLEILKLLVSQTSAKSIITKEIDKDKKPTKRVAAKDKKAAPKEVPAEEKKIALAPVHEVTSEEELLWAEEEKIALAPVHEVTLTDVRSVALKFSRAGRQKELKEIFAKYGANRLSDVVAENYAALLADLEEKVNG